MIIGLALCVLLLQLTFTFIKTKKAIHMLQLNSYRNKRLLRWANENLTKVFRVKELISLLAFIPLFFNNVLFSIILFVIFYSVMTFFRKVEPEKKKLVFTARVKRLTVTTIILVGIVYTLAIYQLLAESNHIAFLTLIFFINIFVYGFVLLANSINLPIEKAINEHYYKDAERIITSLPSLKVIGITGSFGKTSTKHILNEILSSQFNTLMTPESYNTKLGNTITIRTQLKPYHDFYIAEMGAKERNDIKEICDLVHQQYSIITAIGEQHLETFKSLENIQKTKFEIVETLPENGTAILNRDDENIMSYPIQSKCRKIYYAIENDAADYQALDIKFHNKGTSFRVINKEKGFDETFETVLLGRHNVYNILSAIALAVEVGVPIEKMKRSVKQIAPVKHRLEVKRTSGNITIIDDSFNSNPTGSKMALEVLGSMEGYKILITPGMIELGEKQYEYNKAFGAYAADACDYIILVGEKQTAPIKDGIDSKGYPQEQVYIAKNLQEAIKQMNTIAKPGSIVLLENDLPDTFNE